MALPVKPEQDIDDQEFVSFKKEIDRLQKEFDVKIRAILDRVRNRKLKEIQKKLEL